MRFGNGRGSPSTACCRFTPYNVEVRWDRPPRSAHLRPYRFRPEHKRELVRRLGRAESEREPVLVEIAGNRYRLVPIDEIRTTSDPVAGYDSAKVLEARDASVGASAGMDVAAFRNEIAEAREQDFKRPRGPSMRYLIDITVLVPFLADDPAAADLLRNLEQDGIAVSILAYLEAYQGVIERPDPTETREAFDAFFRAVPVLPVSSAVGRRRAELRALLKRQGKNPRRLSFDLVIAATALDHGLELVTHNTQDFRDLPGLGHGQWSIGFDLLPVDG